MSTFQELTARLAVGAVGGPNSATLRVWSPAGDSDVYAAVRDIAGDLKVSLHESGQCHAGLTSQFALREKEVVEELGSRHQNRWQRQTHVGSRFIAPLQFSFPSSELRVWRPVRRDDARLLWISDPGHGRSIIVTCGYSGQSVSDEDWPGKPNGTQLVATKTLPNGEKFWLIWQNCPTSERELSMMRAARDRLARKAMIPFRSTSASDQPMARILVFEEDKPQPVLVVLDMAA